MSFGRGGGGMGGGEPSVDQYEWPSAKAAFTSGGVRVTPEGDMWVRRSVSAGDEVLFDVFGPDAKLKARVFLPAGRRIVGFGEATVYVIATDEFDLQYLEQYRRET